MSAFCNSRLSSSDGITSILVLCVLPFKFQKEPSTCSDSILSDMMPDIAMATASMNQMSLQDLDLGAHGDLELDLGDGNSHSGTGTLYI